MSAGPPPDPPEQGDGRTSLARATWSLTAVVLFLFGVLLLVQGYVGYAIVTLVIALAAAINLI